GIDIEIAMPATTQIGTSYISYQNGYNRGYYDLRNLKNMVEDEGSSYEELQNKLASYVYNDLKIRVPLLYFYPTDSPDSSIDFENADETGLPQPYKFDLLLEQVPHPDNSRLLWELIDVELID
ncbi:MAG: hypothetical protein HQK66_08035, partial [Desulfamplus sp.]|nr:hypothetical protein [Desulfamplus sp.]